MFQATYRALIQQSGIKHPIIANLTPSQEPENTKAVLHRNVDNTTFRSIHHSITRIALRIAKSIPAAMNLHNHRQAFRRGLRRRQHVQYQAVFGLWEAAGLSLPETSVPYSSAGHR
jgi:hypothetical protein